MTTATELKLSEETHDEIHDRIALITLISYEFQRGLRMGANDGATMTPEWEKLSVDEKVGWCEKTTPIFLRENLERYASKEPSIQKLEMDQHWTAIEECLDGLTSSLDETKKVGSIEEAAEEAFSTYAGCLSRMISSIESKDELESVLLHVSSKLKQKFPGFPGTEKRARA